MRGVYFYSNSRYGFFALVLFFRPALYIQLLHRFCDAAIGRYHQKENAASCDNILLMILACLCENTGLLWSKRLRSCPALPRQINGPDDKNVRNNHQPR
jgi:hypothetical protein